MVNAQNLRGCEVFIYGENTDNVLGHTSILEFDSKWNVITIDGMILKREEGSHVIVLVIGENVLMEFQGTIRKTDSLGRREIALFKGAEKEKRQSIRYKINMPAQFTGIIVGTKLIPRTIMNVTVINLSTNGTLLQSPPLDLNLGVSIQLKMKINKKEVSVTAKITRIQEISKCEVQYGCILVSRS